MAMDELKYKDGKFTVNGIDVSNVSATTEINESVQEISANTSQFSVIDNPEFQSVITDADEKILYGVYTDGTETDIDLTGLRITNPETGNEVRLQLVIDDLKNKVNE